MAIAYQYYASGYFAGEVDDYGLLPNNATYTRSPSIQAGKWPCWTGKAWKQVDDHRKRENLPELVARYGEQYPQKATEYWLPEDTHDTPARTMKEIGMLPKGALLEQPAEPEQTIFEKIAEAQAPFIEEQALAKKEYQTADIEGDEEWKAEAQAEYQASIVAMKEAAEQAKGGE